jgi:hypothetical protein
MRGRSSSLRPGARTRRGPAQDRGEQRSLQIGSVSTDKAPSRRWKLLWPMNVTPAALGGGVARGSPVGGGSSIWSGQRERLPDKRQRRTGRMPLVAVGRAEPTAGLKNTEPSQWSEGGKVVTAAPARVCGDRPACIEPTLVRAGMIHLRRSMSWLWRLVGSSRHLVRADFQHP